ncbi:hypothetical protein ACL6C3_29395 [Capilliphycus salinus ALCB114379]|uniref:hypothetical protein n=1 Tax=Capilliphycus salinus TaxID=2768948 RepID=UPI0039A4F268
MEDNSRSSYSVYAQIMQWERAQRLAEYKQQQELERLRTGSKPSPLQSRNVSKCSHSSRLQSSLKPKKHIYKTNNSVAIFLILGWLMGIVTYWGFTQVSANFTAKTQQQNSVLLRSNSLSYHQFSV